MLYEISKEVATELKAQACPIPVVYGPERTASSAGVAIASSRIVFERDRRGGDRDGPGRGRMVNPKMVAVQTIGAVCRIFAQSTDAGARVQDHERVADLAWSLLRVALYKVMSKRKDPFWRITSMRLVSADELKLAGLEVWPGVVYEVLFSVDRAINDTTWTEAAKPEATVTAAGHGTPGVTIQSTDEIKLTNGPPAALPETAC